MLCPHCGQPKPEQAQRGPLLVTREPHAVYWQGVRRHGPTSPTQCEILFLLAQRGEATHLALEMLSDKNGASIKVLICRLRKWLVREDIPLAIKGERGFGYRLS